MDSTQRVRAMLSFVQAADHGSFRAAAQRLGISATAVGKNVAGLEAALGVRLMNRSTRSLQLTDEGRAFLENARLAIDALDNAIESVAARRLEPAGRVRISTGSAVGRRYLLPLLPELMDRYPGIIPDISFDDHRVDLVREGFDLALRGGVMEDSSLISRRICHLLTVLVAAPSYLARHGVPRKPSDLAHHRLIAVRFLNGTMSAWQFRTATAAMEELVPNNAALIVSDPEAAVAAAANGLGIAQVGIHHSFSDLREGRLKLVLAEHHESGGRELALQYPHRAMVAPRVRATVEFLLQKLSGNEALQAEPEGLIAYRA